MLKLRRRKNSPTPDSHLYYCPTANEVESSEHGGFTVCCERPDVHLPMPDTPATHLVGEVLNDFTKRLRDLTRHAAHLAQDAAFLRTAVAAKGAPVARFMVGPREETDAITALSLQYDGSNRVGLLVMDAVGQPREVTVHMDRIVGVGVRVETRDDRDALLDPQPRPFGHDPAIQTLGRRRVVITLDVA